MAQTLAINSADYNTNIPVLPPAEKPVSKISAAIDHVRNAQEELLAAIDRAQDSVGIKQQEADTQNVNVQSKMLLDVYNQAQVALTAWVTLLNAAGSDSGTIQILSTDYQNAQTMCNTTEQQGTGAVSAATPIATQDSQNMAKIADLATSMASLMSAVQQLMNGF